MNKINIRYGEDVTLNLDAGDDTAVGATLYVGKAGQLPAITNTITLTEGIGNFELTDSDTSIPLGEYKYQINVEYQGGAIEKFPNPDDCDDCTDDGFPLFCVFEALDETEIVS